MSDAWVNIKFWIKTTIISILAIYVILFIYNNTGDDRTVSFWWWFGNKPTTSVFIFAAVSFVAGVLVTLLIQTTLTTLKQHREMKAMQTAKRLVEQETKAKRLKLLPTQPASATEPAVRRPDNQTL